MFLGVHAEVHGGRGGVASTFNEWLAWGSGQVIQGREARKPPPNDGCDLLAGRSHSGWLAGIYPDVGWRDAMQLRTGAGNAGPPVRLTDNLKISQGGKTG